MDEIKANQGNAIKGVGNNALSINKRIVQVWRHAFENIFENLPGHQAKSD